MPEVVIPPAPGVTSAAGLLASNLRYDVIQSMLRPLATLDPEALENTLGTHESSLAEQLRADGCPDERIEIVRAADLRYPGQGYELTVPIDARPADSAAVSRLRQTFDEGPPLRVRSQLHGLRRRARQRPRHGSRSALRASPAERSRGSTHRRARRHTARQFQGRGRARRATDPGLPTRRATRRSCRGWARDSDQFDTTTLLPPGTSVRREVEDT